MKEGNLVFDINGEFITEITRDEIHRIQLEK